MPQKCFCCDRPAAYELAITALPKGADSVPLQWRLCSHHSDRILHLLNTFDDENPTQPAQQPKDN